MLSLIQQQDSTSSYLFYPLRWKHDPARRSPLAASAAAASVTRSDAGLRLVMPLLSALRPAATAIGDQQALNG